MAPSVQILRSHSRSTSHNVILFSIFIFSQVARAALSLQDLQPIAHFPATCQSAYATPIQSCPDANSFSLSGGSTGPGGCTQDCFSSIVRAVANIQQACQGSAAPPGTVIAHAFSGDLASFLCGGSGGNSQPTSDSNPTTTVASTNSGNTSKLSATSTSQASSDTNSSTISNSATSTSTSSTSSTSSSSTSASSTPNQTSPSSTITRSSTLKSLTTSSSTSTKSQATLNAGGGGSPFDQTVPNSAPTPINGQSMLSLAVGVAVAVALGP